MHRRINFDTKWRVKSTLDKPERIIKSEVKKEKIFFDECIFLTTEVYES